jgi:hypothetical protein
LCDDLNEQIELLNLLGWQIFCHPKNF